MDRIEISGLWVDCVVGVYPSERGRSQPLVVDLALGLSTEAAAVSERLRESIDYAALSAQVDFLLVHGQFRLLETAAHVLAKYLLAPPAPGERRAAVESVRVRLTKPDALEGKGTASLEIERDAGWATLTHETKPFGTVDVVHETRAVGVYRLNIEPGRQIPLHVHRSMREAEMVLSAGLCCQGQPMPAYAVHRWPKDAPHTYKNEGDRVASILCVDAPPFIEEDEIPATGEPAEVTRDPLWLRVWEQN